MRQRSVLIPAPKPSPADAPSAVRAVSLLVGFGLALVTVLAGSGAAVAQDTSAAAILQMFEARYDTMESRAIDMFYAGYGGLWVPPTGRADSGNQSVGYDVYNRFDLGSAGNPTLYGTEAGLKAVTAITDRSGQAVYADFIPNHSGFSDSSTGIEQPVDNPATPTFVSQGDYPQFVTTLPNDVDGDYHSAFNQGSDLTQRLAGLIDFDQSKNHRFIRQPVAIGDPNNIPGGTVADRPDPNNARFYTDRDLGGRAVYDPRTGQHKTIYDFNTTTPLAGDAVIENANDVIARNARWLVQEIGVDGLRIDASRHFEPYVLDLLDVQLHNAITQRNLDGSRRQTFSFSETFTGDMGTIQARVRKEDLGEDTVGGNRDGLDFPLFFAMRDNLTDNGYANDWRNIKNASFDIHDDGLANNGSQGVAHVQSHDEHGPTLSNVAHAFMLMRPGNAIVYFNAKEFGGGRGFPKDGRRDALGGQFGNAVTTLVGLRNSHGRGNYLDRTPDANPDPDNPDAKSMLIYEREKSALVVLSNRLDGGYDERTVQTSFRPGTYLVELTGNAEDATIDPFDDFPSVVQVNGDGTVNLRVLRNRAPGDHGAQHNSGYLVYGLATPQGQLSLSNVARTLEGSTPTTAAANGTTRLGDVDVVTADSFTVTLNTHAVNLLGSIRDRDADGDAAFLKLDGGMDLNGSGYVDFVTPGSVLYGFESFNDINAPGFFDDDGRGLYEQSIDTTGLAEGYHFLTARAFRHRNPQTGGDGGPEVFSDFKRAIYIDRLAPEAAVDSTVAFGSDGDDLDFRTRSLDGTATEVFTFLNLGAAIDDATILDWVENDPGGSGTTRIDRGLFQRGYFDVQSGNNVLTVVTREVTGNTNIQRLVVGLDTSRGSGVGDIDADGALTALDLSDAPTNFETFLYARNAWFNPAADANADGRIDTLDLLALGQLFTTPGVSQSAADKLVEVRNRRGNLNGNGNTDSFDLLFMRDHRGTTDPGRLWSLDINPDGVIDGDDAELFVTAFLLETTGDFTRDGVIDGDDVDAMILAFTDVHAYQTQYAIDVLVTGDINRNWVFDRGDIEPFLALLGDPAARQKFVDAGLLVPEPATAVLMLLGALGVARRPHRQPPSRR